ncbi:MAG: prepilin-type N-terminal cleavage/methylation domain-containing protein [Candidatus Gastranaerophilaceae bacterium]
MKKAFNLAEILITLGIIGVVAAMTIPNIITKYQKAQTIAHLKESYSIILQAVKLSEEENGDAESWDWELKENKNIDEFFEKYILNYLGSYSKTKKNITWKRLGTSGSDQFSHNGTPKWMLKNGMIIGTTDRAFPYYSSTNGQNRLKLSLPITIDLNGYSGPNRYGRDVFMFSIFPRTVKLNTKVFPGAYEQCGSGGLHYLYTRTQLTKGGCATCRTDKMSTGQACANLIIMDGWKIEKDYPW